TITIMWNASRDTNFLLHLLMRTPSTARLDEVRARSAPSSRNSPGRMWPTRAYSFRLVAIMGTTKISPHRSPWRLGGHRPRHLAKPFVGRSGFASGRGSRPARSPLGPNLRHEAASLQNLEHVRGERIETVDATVREMD